MANNTNKNLSTSTNLMIFIILIMMIPAPLAIDIYAPSFPAMVESLQTSVQLVQLSIPIYLLALSFDEIVQNKLSSGFLLMFG